MYQGCEQKPTPTVPDPSISSFPHSTPFASSSPSSLSIATATSDQYHFTTIPRLNYHYSLLSHPPPDHHHKIPTNAIPHSPAMPLGQKQPTILTGWMGLSITNREEMNGLGSPFITSEWHFSRLVHGSTRHRLSSNGSTWGAEQGERM